MNETQNVETKEKNVCYAANWTTTERKNLKLSFENGQSFLISVKACN